MKSMFPIFRVGAVGALALTMTVAATGVANAADLDQAEANSVSAAVKAVAPVLPVQAATLEGDAFVAESTELATSIPRSTDNAVELSIPETATAVSLQLPLGVNTDAPVLAKDGTVVFANAQESVDVAVQALAGGVRAQTVIGANATTDSFEYELGHGVTPRLESDGSISVWADGQDSATEMPVGLIERPWAVDADGVPVSTVFEVNGSTVTQHVDLSQVGISYPVVADPTFWWGWNFYLSNAQVNKLVSLIKSGAPVSAVVSSLAAFAGSLGKYVGLAAALIQFGGWALNNCNVSHKGVYLGRVNAGAWLPSNIAPAFFYGFFCYPQR